MPTINGFVPMTGRGCFDCTYFPGDTVISIVVKVRALYENAKQENIYWTEKDQWKFQMSAQEAVQRYWNNKFTLVNRHTNPAQRVTPLFSVNFVEQKDATVLMRVPRYNSAYGPGNLARCDSYVGLEQINTDDPNAKSKAMVHSESTKPINIKLTEGSNIARDERRRIDGIAVSLGLDNVPFAGGGNLTPQLTVALANFATQLKLGTPSRPMVPIVISLNVGGGQMQAATQQGTAMRAKLLSFNVLNPVVVQPGANQTGNLSVGADQGFETTFNGDIWMSIFAHEYGHMLGLPDEYDPAPPPQSNVPKDIAIQRFLDMAGSFGVAPPLMGSMTTSIMCKGTDLLPCHMLTALQALCVLSKDGNWRVG